MRSLLVVFCAVLLLTVTAPLAFGQMMPGGGAPMFHERDAKELTPEQFSEMKARMLKMLDERKARLEQEKACVDAAKNADELRKCRPEPPMGPMGQGGRFRGSANGERSMVPQDAPR